MKLPQNTFLQKLYRQDKALFFLVVFYCLGILYCCRWSREEFPFLLYGMYSLKEAPQETYTTYTFEVDSMEMSPARFLDPKKELIASSMENGAVKYRSGQMNAAQMKELTDWLYRLYFTPWETDTHNRREIYQLTCTYDKDGCPRVLKKEIVYSNVQR